jgi:hypothetical protein
MQPSLSLCRDIASETVCMFLLANSFPPMILVQCIHPMIPSLYYICEGVIF